MCIMLPSLNTYRDKYFIFHPERLAYVGCQLNASSLKFDEVI